MMDKELQVKLDAYPVKMTEKVVWGDMDAFQHVNNTVYFRYFESVRMEFMRQTDMLELFENSQIGPILAASSCDFRAPLTYPDTIHIGARVTDIQDRKFYSEYIVISEKLNKVAAEGSGLMVYFDYATGKACSVPEAVAAAIRKL